MVESALKHIEISEKNALTDIIISLKSSDVWMMIQAYRKLAKLCDYPFPWESLRLVRHFKEPLNHLLVSVGYYQKELATPLE